MSLFASRVGLSGSVLAGSVLAALVLAVPSSAQFAEITSPPDFSGNGWINENTFDGGGLVAMPGQPYFKQDSRYPHVPNNTGAQPTYWIADLASNPNVKQWAKDIMKKDNDDVIKGLSLIHI